MRSEVMSFESSRATLTMYGWDDSTGKEVSTLRPALLIFPGGGYRHCSDREADPIAFSFLSRGYQCFILRYSVGEVASFEQALRDASTALHYLHDHAQSLGIDNDKIAVCGFSAGGHLAASLGTMGDIRPNALILGYPCILSSMSSIFPFEVPSADQYVDERTPETFLFHTFQDGLVPVENPMAFATALDRYKVPFEFHLFRNGGHGLSLGNALTANGSEALMEPDFAKWVDLCAAWLQHVFSKD